MPFVDGVFVAPKEILAKYGVATDKTMQVPVSFDFAPFGTFGKWFSVDLYRVGTYSEAVKELDPKPALVNVTQGKGYIEAFYRTLAEAQAATKALGEGFVNHWIRVQSEKKFSYALPQPEKWADPLVFNVKDVTTTRAGKRHVYNMVYLPSLVHAAAPLFGYEVPEMTAFNELLAADTIFDDELEYAMIGHPDANVDDDNHWTKSKLWQQRANLWRALGEPDPRKAYLAGSGARESETTWSEPLSNVLSFATAPLEGTYAKLVQLPDPHSDGKRTDAEDETRSSRYSLVMVDTIYESDEAMRAAAEEQAERTGDSVDSPPFAADWSMPAAWATIDEEQFKAAIAEELSNGKPKMVVAKNLEISLEELNAAIARYEL